MEEVRQLRLSSRVILREFLNHLIEFFLDNPKSFDEKKSEEILNSVSDFKDAIESGHDAVAHMFLVFNFHLEELTSGGVGADVERKRSSLQKSVTTEAAALRILVNKQTESFKAMHSKIRLIPNHMRTPAMAGFFLSAKQVWEKTGRLEVVSVTMTVKALESFLSGHEVNSLRDHF